MPDNFLSGLFDPIVTTSITAVDFLLYLFVSLLVGAFLAMVYAYKTRYTKSFVVTLALLPAVVCVVIMLVNGNVGAGVAVAGTFSLVRFRSVPGTAKEICAIFLAMAAGLATGMGFLTFSVIFVLIMGGVNMIYTRSRFGEKRDGGKYRSLKIVIPEDLDYTHVFDDVFSKYTSSCELISVKTTNMGSLFSLVYDVELKDASAEKDFIDLLRCRNGNLEIISAVHSTADMNL